MADVGTLSARLRIDTSQFQGALAKGTATLRQNARKMEQATNRMTGSIRTANGALVKFTASGRNINAVTNNFRRLRVEAERAAASMTRVSSASVVAGGARGGRGGVAAFGLGASLASFAKYMVASTVLMESLRIPRSIIENAAEFEDAMANIGTIVQGNVPKMEAMKKNIMDLSKELPVEQNLLAASSYHIFSAGITDVADATNVLRAATKLSIAGLGEHTATTKMLSAAINAYGLDINEAEQAANILFEQVRLGVLTVSDLTSQFGATAALANTTGITFRETAAMTAALTIGGLKAAQAQQFLGRLFVQVTGQSGKFKKAIEKAGISMDQFRKMIKTKGLVPALEEVQRVMKKTDEQMVDLMTRKGARVAASMLLGTEKVQQKYLELIDSTKMADKLDLAVDIKTETFDAKMTELKSSWQRFTVTVGDTGFLDTAKKAVDDLATAVNGLALVADEYKGIKKDAAAAREEMGGVAKTVLDFIDKVPKTPIGQINALFQRLGEGPDLTNAKKNAELMEQQVESLRKVQGMDREFGIQDIDSSGQLKITDTRAQEATLSQINLLSNLRAMAQDRVELEGKTRGQIRKLEEQYGQDAVTLARNNGGNVAKAYSEAWREGMRVHLPAAREEMRNNAEILGKDVAEFKSPIEGLFKAEQTNFIKGQIKNQAEVIAAEYQTFNAMLEAQREKSTRASRRKDRREGEIQGPFLEDIFNKKELQRIGNEYNTMLTGILDVQAQVSTEGLGKVKADTQARLNELIAIYTEFGGRNQKIDRRSEKQRLKDALGITASDLEAEINQIRGKLAAIDKLQAEGVGEVAPIPTDDAAAITQNMMTQVNSELETGASQMGEKMKTGTDAVVTNVSDMANQVSLQSIVPDMVDAIADQFARLDAVMVQPLTAASNAVTNIFSSWKTLVESGGGAGMADMAANMTAGWENVTTAVTNGVNVMIAGVSTGMTVMSASVQSILSSMSSTSTNTMSRMMNSMVSVTQSGWNRIVATFRSGVNRANAESTRLHVKQVKRSIFPEMMHEIRHVMRTGWLGVLSDQVEFVADSIDVSKNYEEAMVEKAERTAELMDSFRVIGDRAFDNQDLKEMNTELERMETIVRELGRKKELVPGTIPKMTKKDTAESFELKLAKFDQRERNKMIAWQKQQLNIEIKLMRDRIAAQKFFYNMENQVALAGLTDKERELKEHAIKSEEVLLEFGKMREQMLGSLINDLERQKEVASELEDLEERLKQTQHEAAQKLAAGVAQEEFEKEHPYLTMIRQMTAVGPEAFTSMSDFLERVFAKNVQFQELTKDSFEAFGDGMVDAVANWVGGMATGIDDAGENMLASTYQLLGGLASAFGDFFITTGIPMLVTPGQQAVGAAMIAGGIALKALGSLFGGLASKTTGASGSGGGGGVTPLATTPDVEAQEQGQFTKGDVVIEAGELAGRAGFTTDMGNFIREFVKEFNDLTDMGINFEVR